MSDFELEGISPAIPSPRYESDDPLNPGDANYEALEEGVGHVEEGGVQSLTATGCTGRSSLFTYDEQVEFIGRVTDMTDLPVIAGTGTNETRETYELASRVEESADIAAHLMISPYKLKPEPEGVEQHYTALADNLEKPIVLYDVPSRTGRQMDVDSVVSLAEHPNIIGLKDATGDKEYVQRIDGRLEMEGIDDFNIVSGDDPNSPYVYELENGTGTISVTANVAPEAVVDVWETAYIDGDHEKAYAMNEELAELHGSMFLESNPGPVHEALSMMGFDYEAVPAPLNRVNEENREQLGDVLQQYGLIEQ